MRFLIGAVVISFGLLFLVMVVLNAMGIKSPSDSPAHFGLVWLVLAVVCYPLARKIMR
jgi:hypothetical protein